MATTTISPVLTQANTTSGATILLVDDDVEFLQTLADALRAMGHHVECANSAEDALDEIGRKRYDAAIVDVKLPLLDGFGMVLRARELAPTTALVMLSGYAGLDNAVMAADCGAVNYLVKPVDLGELSAAIHQAVNIAPGSSK
jgi:DNA-binding response OmpR family regulator